jgi:hypothetical protein
MIVEERRNLLFSLPLFFPMLFCLSVDFLAAAAMTNARARNKLVATEG